MDGVRDGRHLLENDEDDVLPVDVSSVEGDEVVHVFGDDVTEQRTGDEAV